MELNQAKEIVAFLAAAYPSQLKSEETATVYIGFIRDMPFEDTFEAIQRLVKHETWLPPIANIITELELVRGARWTPPPALPKPPMSEEDQRYIAHMLAEYWKGRPETRMKVELENAVASGDSEAREKVARAMAAQVVAEPPNVPLPRMQRSRVVCVGAGARPIKKDGVLVCPGCNVPIEPITIKEAT